MTGTQKYNREPQIQGQGNEARLKADLSVSGDDTHISIGSVMPKEKSCAQHLRLASELRPEPHLPGGPVQSNQTGVDDGHNGFEITQSAVGRVPRQSAAAIPSINQRTPVISRQLK